MRTLKCLVAVSSELDRAQVFYRQGKRAARAPQRSASKTMCSQSTAAKPPGLVWGSQNQHPSPGDS